MFTSRQTDVFIAQVLQEGRIAGKPSIDDPSPLGCYAMAARKQLTAL